MLQHNLWCMPAKRGSGLEVRHAIFVGFAMGSMCLCLASRMCYYPAVLKHIEQQMEKHS